MAAHVRLHAACSKVARKRASALVSASELHGAPSAFLCVRARDRLRAGHVTCSSTRAHPGADGSAPDLEPGLQQRHTGCRPVPCRTISGSVARAPIAARSESRFGPPESVPGARHDADVVRHRFVPGHDGGEAVRRVVDNDVAEARDQLFLVDAPDEGGSAAQGLNPDWPSARLSPPDGWQSRARRAT